MYAVTVPRGGTVVRCRNHIPALTSTSSRCSSSALALVLEIVNIPSGSVELTRASVVISSGKLMSSQYSTTVHGPDILSYIASVRGDEHAHCRCYCLLQEQS